MQRQQKGKNLEGKRNMASLGLGESIAANSQGGLWVSGGKGDRMQGSQRRSAYQTKGRLEKTGWKSVTPWTRDKLGMVERGSWRGGRLFSGL